MSTCQMQVVGESNLLGSRWCDILGNDSQFNVSEIILYFYMHNSVRSVSLRVKIIISN